MTYWVDMPRGGHFAAMEQPALFADDVQRFFRTVRTATLTRRHDQAMAGRMPGRTVPPSCVLSTRIGVPFTSTCRTPVGSSAVRRSASAGKSRTRVVGPGPTVCGSNTHTSAQ